MSMSKRKGLQGRQGWCFGKMSLRLETNATSRRAKVWKVFCLTSKRDTFDTFDFLNPTIGNCIFLCFQIDFFVDVSRIL